MNADSQNTDYYILSLGSDYEIEIVVNKIKYITDNQKKNTFLLRAFSRTFTQLFLILVSELSLGSDYDIKIVVNKIKYITDNQKKIHFFYVRFLELSRSFLDFLNTSFRVSGTKPP